jgi:hypothetical protein
LPTLSESLFEILEDSTSTSSSSSEEFDPKDQDLSDFEDLADEIAF